MSVDDRQERAVRRHIGEQALDVASRMDEAVLACPLCGRPAGIQPVGRSDGEQADIAPVFRHEAYGFDRFRRQAAGIGDDDLRIGTGLSHPIAAIDDVGGEIGVCSVGLWTRCIE